MLKVAVPSWLNLPIREAYEFRQYLVEIMGLKYRTYLVTKEPAMIAGYYAAQSKVDEALEKKRELPDEITRFPISEKSTAKNSCYIGRKR